MKKLILIIALAITAHYCFGQTTKKAIDTAKNDPVPSAAARRVTYDQVFKRNSDGSFSAIRPVQINGENIGSDVPFTRGKTFGGVDVAGYAEHDLLIDTIGGVVIIRKIY
jgi:hypothetical protein